MRPKTLLVLVALVVALMVSAPQTFAQNLVQNGSFETGDLPTGQPQETSNSHEWSRARLVPLRAPRTAIGMSPLDRGTLAASARPSATLPAPSTCSAST